MQSPSLRFVRHAESVWNARGLWQGQADPPLSDAGRLQAAELAEALAQSTAPGLLATSDLARARQTAEVVATRLGVPVRLEPGLRELDVGVWSGLEHAEIERRFPDELARFRSGDVDLCAGGGESRRVLRCRVDAALARLRAAAGAVPLLVVSHLGVLRVLQPGADLAHAGWVWLEAASAGQPTYPPERGAL